MTLTLIAVFGVFQLILFLMHAVIFETLALSFGWGWTWLSWVFVILSFTFVSSSALTFRYDNTFIKWYYRFGAYWFGLSIFLFVGAFGAYFTEYFLYNHLNPVSSAVIGGVFVGGMLFLHIYATWQTNRIKLSRVELSLGDVPSDWRGKKIIFISDVHLGAVRSEGFARKVARRIEQEGPELVLIGGDIFDGVKCHPQSLLDPFAGLRIPRGTYFASGNHEYIKDTPELLLELKRAGIKILDNEAVNIHGLQVIGVDWKETFQKEKFEDTLEKIKIQEKGPSILLRHEPNHLEVAAKAGVSLTLCGHTHAGQIFPLRFITYKIYHGFDYGLKRLGDMMVYTSSGIGTWGPPLRFGTKSEMVAITLK